MLHCGRWTMIESDQFSGLTTVPTSSISWEEGEDGYIPDGAVVGGKTLTEETTYIGRTRLVENRNELTPGVIIPSEKCLLVPYGTGVRSASKYEVLVGSNHDYLQWIPCHGGNVPNNSVIGGMDCSYLEPLYIGRTMGSLEQGRTWRGRRLELSDRLGNTQIPGKVHQTHKCLYVPFMEKEYLFRHYEVLAFKESPASLKALSKHSIRQGLSQNYPHEFAEQDCEVQMKLIDQLQLPEKLKEYCKLDFMQH
uniref:Uncharacterized protein LOC100184299 n=1 Tax=Phallusia mammillata TaxID=59560 RepID=A0A6F9DIY2_9ASCI|nr:uncharacterized protein LOC100184299 [Phallusia mammillata]